MENTLDPGTNPAGPAGDGISGNALSSPIRAPRSMPAPARRRPFWGMLPLMGIALPTALRAADGAPGIDSGDTAWMAISTVLVLFMVLPGLALFYGGMVRKKNVLSVFASLFAIAGIVSFLWWAVGFSLSFSPGNPFVGGLSALGFSGVGAAPGNLPTVPQNIFAIFQLTFAIITPCLIVGAVAERMKFSAILAFVTIWLFAVYFPFAHMVWGGGLLSSTIHAIDFAGGTVVHISAGFSALVLCIVLGKRRGYGRDYLAPHSVVLTAIGTGMLWAGWYGFNAGSAGAADGIAGNAIATTTFAAAIGGLAWGSTEWILKGKPSVLGFSSGVIGGLVAITPAAGFVSIGSSFLFGLLGGAIPFFCVAYLKKAFGYDDALDAFGVHGIGGTIGAILTGIFADARVNPLVDELQKAGVNLTLEQLKAVGITIVWSVVASLLIALAIKATIGLRVSADAEQAGLDTSEHGEEGYIG